MKQHFNTHKLSVRQILASPLASTLIAALGLVAIGVQPAAAQLINLNFTLPGADYVGTTETSPATQGGAAGTWNNLTNTIANGTFSVETDGQAVLYSDGSTGPTLTFDSSRGNNVWGSDFNTFQSVNYTTAGGVYDVANLYETGIAHNANNTAGFRIRGLTPGTYEVFLVTIFRSSQAAGAKVDPSASFIIGLGNDTDARNVGDYTLTSTAISTFQSVDTRLTSWVAAGDGSTNSYNYISATVTIDSEDRWLTFLLPDSGTSGPDRAGVSAIQLHIVPEPGAAAILGCGLAIVVMMLRNRRY